MTEKLKPCPAGHTNIHFTPFVSGLISVMCYECGWRATADKASDAVALWNLRPAEEALEKRAKKAERFVKMLREVLDARSRHTYADGTFCAECGSRNPLHTRDCEIGRVLEATKEVSHD